MPNSTKKPTRRATAVVLYEPFSHWQGGKRVIFEFATSKLLKRVTHDLSRLERMPASDRRDHLRSLREDKQRWLHSAAKSVHPVTVGGDGRIRGPRSLGRKHVVIALWLGHQAEAKRYRRVFCPHCDKFYWKKQVTHKVWGGSVELTVQSLSMLPGRDGGAGGGRLHCPRRHLLQDYHWIR